MDMTHRARLTLDSLEDRRTPAGNVAASLSGEVLEIRGDERGNQLRITQTAAGQVRITGLDGTRINGRAAVAFAADGVEKLDALLFGGGDRLEVVNLRASTDFNIETGAGDDAVVLTDVRVGVNATVKTDDGVDTVRGRRVTTGSDFNIDTGTGRSTTTVAGSRVGGSLTVLGQNLTDNVTVGGTTVGKDLNINSGKGNDYVTVTDTAVTLTANVLTDEGTDRVSLTGLTTGEDLKVVTGKDADNVALTRVQVGKNLSVLLDTGTDRLTAGNVAVASDLLFDGGDEFDTFDRNANVRAGQDIEVKGFERTV